MSRTTNDDGMTQSASVEHLALDGFVLLHQLCGSEVVQPLLEVSRRRAREVREAREQGDWDRQRRGLCGDRAAIPGQVGRTHLAAAVWLR